MNIYPVFFLILTFSPFTDILFLFKKIEIVERTCTKKKVRRSFIYL